MGTHLNRPTSALLWNIHTSLPLSPHWIGTHMNASDLTYAHPSPYTNKSVNWKHKCAWTYMRTDIRTNSPVPACAQPSPYITHIWIWTHAHTESHAHTYKWKLKHTLALRQLYAYPQTLTLIVRVSAQSNHNPNLNPSCQKYVYPKTLTLTLTLE